MSTDDDGWTAAENVQLVTLKVSFKCEHCSRPIPVNGPQQHTKCPSCLEDNELPKLGRALGEARRGLRSLSSRFDVTVSDNELPECRKCGQRIRLGKHRHQHGPTTTIECQGCGASMPTYPAPDWLKPQFHGALQIFGGDPALATADGSVALDIAVENAEPVAMSCPSCGAGLQIDAQAERTTSCQFCQASVFIPDGLWRVLHPVPTQDFWTISYEPRRRKKKNKPQQQKPKKQAKPAAPEPAPLVAEPTTGKGQPNFVVIVAFAIALLLVVAYLFRG